MALYFGLSILVGTAAKNGILIVEFANQLRDEGLSVREAVIEAAESCFPCGRRWPARPVG